MAEIRPPLSLSFAEDLEPPSYNWFGDSHLDGWFQNLKGLSSTPFFEAAPEQLATILHASSTQQNLTIDLVSSDCSTSFGHRNCTEVCSDPSALLTPTNFRICTALASAALLVQNGTYAVNHADERTTRAMASWGIPELSTYNSTALFGQVAGCLSQSCILSHLGDCTDDAGRLSDTDITANNLGAITSSLSQYCDGTTVHIDADIAGPGVMISYFLQSILAIFLFVLLKVSTTWLSRVDGLLGRKPPGRLTAAQSTLLTSRLRGAVTSSLAEFQEIQLYFIAAVQVATLISFDRDASSTVGANNSSYAAVILNSGLAGLVNITAMAAVLLVQCCLRQAGMRWWYTFFLMTLTCILAGIIFSRRSEMMPSTDVLWEKFKDDAPLPFCGNNPSPMAFCRSIRETKFLDNDIGGFIAYSLGLFSLIGLWVDQLVFTIRKKYPAILTWMASHLDRQHRFRRRGTMFSSMAALYWAAVEFLLLLLAGFHISQLILIVDDVSFADAGGWGFGQLIAVTVWAPTIVKFLYFNIFGIREGFEERIGEGYDIG